MNKLRQLLKGLGPGFVTGAADDDPSGIVTYSQTGAQFGYNQLWAAPFSFPFMTVVQEMCGRIGRVTGDGLAGVIKCNYPKGLLYFSVLLLTIANTVNIGTDLGAMASAAQLLFRGPFVFWLLLIALVSLYLQVTVPYQTYAKYLKFFTFSLLAYIVTAFIVHIDWGRVLYATVTPEVHFQKDYLMNLVAILGTTISPYLFFWQCSEEVEEELAEGKLEEMGKGRPKVSWDDINTLRLDTMFGMFFGSLIFYFIVVTTASTLAPHGIHDIQTATQAAEALRPLAGEFTYFLFAAGILGTGLLAVPVLSGSASYAISETFGWKQGLSLKFSEAKGFYSVIIASVCIGLFINFSGIAPFKMLYYTAILNGLCAPPLLVLIMLISNNQKILGCYTNGRLSNILGWIITAIMSIAAITLLITFGQ